MKITRLEAYALRAKPPERPHWTSHFIVPTANEILVRLFTDEGIDGFGLATSYTPIEFAIKAWKGGLADQIVGEDEADLKLGLVNIGSPIARALIGKEEGDTAEVVAPGGIRHFEIVAVNYL